MNCRLYLVSPTRLDHPAIFAEELRAACDGGDVAAFLLRLIDADAAAITRAADILRPVCQQRDVAFLLADRPDLALKLDADGVEVDPELFAEARRLLGRDRQVGVVCPASRHVAMEAADAGADYVTFDAASLDLIEWWDGLFEVPCVAAGDIQLVTAQPLIAAGADFLAVRDAVWSPKAGPKEAVTAFNALMSSNG